MFLGFLGNDSPENALPLGWWDINLLVGKEGARYDLCKENIVSAGNYYQEYPDTTLISVIFGLLFR